MTKIEMFDTEAKRIKELSAHVEDSSCFDDAFAVEAIFDALDNVAKLFGKTAEQLVLEFYA